MSFDSLPIIIVTAQTKSEAAEIMTEMIDDDITSEVRPAGVSSCDVVWRLVNKYYSATVRVHGRGAEETPRRHAGGVQAHVVLLAERELTCEQAAQRLDTPAWLGPPADVNVLACVATEVPGPLQELCAARRLEPVALRSHCPEEGEAVTGVAALRAALHAHVWPGLQPLRDHRLHPAVDSDASSSDGGSEDEGEEGVDGGDLDAAERFALALGALAAAAALPAPQRRAQADQLVATFAAALGHPHLHP